MALVLKFHRDGIIVTMTVPIPTDQDVVFTDTDYARLAELAGDMADAAAHATRPISPTTGTLRDSALRVAAQAEIVTTGGRGTIGWPLARRINQWSWVRRLRSRP